MRRWADWHFYGEAHGPLMPGTRFDPRCPNGLCVNPDHREAVTQTAAMEHNGRATLTEAAARAILEAGTTVPLREHAGRYGVTLGTVRAVLNGATWRDVAPELPCPLVATEGRLQRGEAPALAPDGP